jgi:Flp pilus assembly CpaF family ATPase/MinD-like ATPase involved in chromosome partitioning or flagellar assembly
MANKLILVTGDRDGVGKTTIAVNLAARLSQMRHQPVVVIDADPLCRNESAQAVGTSPGASVLTSLDQLAGRQISWPMFRGRIPTSNTGVGVINLATSPRDISRLTPEQWSFFLQGLNQYYDLVVDIEAHSALRHQAIDLADGVVYTLLPNATSLRGALQDLDGLHNQKFSFSKFILTLNQAGLPQGMPEDSVSQALTKFDEELDAVLPFEPEILRLTNQGRSAILDLRRSVFSQQITAMTEICMRLVRERSGFSITPGAGFAEARGGPATQTPAESAIVNKILQEKVGHWNSIKQQLHRDLVEELNVRRVDLDTKGDPVRERQLRTNVESTVNALISKEKELALAREEREQLVKELVDEALGLGPLEELLRDPTITEIMVNRHDQVYIERRGKIALSDKRFIDNNHVVQVIRRIIAPLGRRIDESTPLVDARLRDGSRVNAIIPPLAVNGPSITIRRFPEKAYSPEDLIRMDSLSPAMVEFLRVCVLTKKNVVIAGGTGTGKTTILNMLSSFIPNNERIVTVEDTAELRMQQEHVVRLESRPPNIEGHGAITIRDLVKNSLRMRPDRIVVGECRGGEALDMLQAMNTGHDGSLTTIHANSPRDAFTRLETLCLMAGMDLPVWALREQIRSAVHVVVQLSRLQDGTRKITCITEVTGRTDDHILTQDLFRYVQESTDDKGIVGGHYETTGAKPTFFDDLKTKGLTLNAALFKKP